METTAHKVLIGLAVVVVLALGSDLDDSAAPAPVAPPAAVVTSAPAAPVWTPAPVPVTTPAPVADEPAYVPVPAGDDDDDHHGYVHRKLCRHNPFC